MFEVNAKGFWSKLEKLTFSQKIAMVDVAVQFWSNPNRLGSVQEFLTGIGAAREKKS